MKIEERKVFIEDKKHINQVHNYSKKRGGDVVMKEKQGLEKRRMDKKREGLKRERSEEKNEGREEGIKDEERMDRTMERGKE